MNIITDKKVFTTNVKFPNDPLENSIFYEDGKFSNAAAEVVPLQQKRPQDIIKPTAPPPITGSASAAEMKKKGWDWDKVRGWVKKGAEIGKQTGVLDWAKNKIGGGTTPPPYYPPVSTDPAPTEDKGMSTNTKIIIGVSAAIVITAITYVLVKKK
jgi:hypothetical protein